MKNFMYIGCVCSFLSVVSLSCLDHRDPVPVSPAGSCQIVLETIKSQPFSQLGIPSPPPEETILLDETNAGSPFPSLTPIFGPADRILKLTTSYTNTYRYNSQGQLVEEITAPVKNPTNGNTSVTTYDYTASTLKITKSGPNGAFVDSYTLNDRGLIATRNPFYNYTYTYSYDTNGYLAEVNSVDNSGITTKKSYTIENGNVVKVTIINGNSTTNSTQTITISYDLTKLNLPNKLPVFTGQSIGFFDSEANQSRNLPTKVVYDSFSTQQSDSGIHTIRIINTYYYTYTFDSQDRVKRKLLVHVYSSSISGSPLDPIVYSAFTTDYTYSCAP